MQASDRSLFTHGIEDTRRPRSGTALVHEVFLDKWRIAPVNVLQKRCGRLLGKSRAQIAKSSGYRNGRMLSTDFARVFDGSHFRP